MKILKSLSNYYLYLNTLFSITILTTSVDLNAEIVRRAAFDFGSGKTKLQVADVDTDSHNIVETLYSDAIIVLLSEDAGNHPQGHFSEQIQQQALAATLTLKQKAIELGAEEFMGLATEAYRKAENGQELVDKYLSELNIPVKIIPQEEEGRLGFIALIAETGLDPAQVISWDIGGGSFQITYLDEDSNIQVYMAPFGRITTKNAIIQFVKGEDPLKVSSPNPMSHADWENSLKYFDETLPKVPISLSHKLKADGVRLIGISAHPEKLRSLNTYHTQDVMENLRERITKNDSELSLIHGSPSIAVTELALIQSIMNKLDVSTVDYIRTSSGSTSALLITEKYWK